MKRNQPLDIRTGKLEEIQEFNKRPALETVCAPPQGKRAIDVIKEEVTVPPNINLLVKSVEIEPFLNAKASKLYSNKLDSTVIEYHEMKDGSKQLAEYPLTEGALKRRTSLVRYLSGLASVDHWSDEMPGSDIEEWANLLNHLADTEVWDFGVLTKTFYISLGMDKHGIPYTDVPASLLQFLEPFAPSDDPRRKGWEEMRSDGAFVNRGRTLQICTYIGINPQLEDKYAARDYITFTERLNSHVGVECFVDEGALASHNWRLKKL